MKHLLNHLSSLIVTFSLIVVTIQRDINDDFIAPHQCKSIMKDALDYCQPKLTESANLIDQNGQSIEKVDFSLFNCCNYAQFKLCMDSDIHGKCDYELNLIIKTQAIFGVKKLANFCQDDYSYYVSKLWLVD